MWSLLVALATAMAAPSASWAQRVVDKPSAQVELRFLDVGQGDAVLIRLPDGRYILIDGGRNATEVANLLEREGVDTLELVVASHNHADHIGGLPEVLHRFVVRGYLENKLPATTAVYRQVVMALERNRVRVLEVEPRTLRHAGVSLRILSLPPGLSTQNDNSIGLLLEYGDFRALLTGDAERRELAHWLEHDRIPRVSLVKVAHHGASNGTTPEWVEATRPRMAVISVGRNGYGMPDAEVKSMWRRVASHVEITYGTGTVIVRATSDGGMLLLRADSTGLISPHDIEVPR